MPTPNYFSFGLSDEVRDFVTRWHAFSSNLDLELLAAALSGQPADVATVAASRCGLARTPTLGNQYLHVVLIEPGELDLVELFAAAHACSMQPWAVIGAAARTTGQWPSAEIDVGLERAGATVRDRLVAFGLHGHRTRVGAFSPSRN